MSQHVVNTLIKLFPVNKHHVKKTYGVNEVFLISILGGSKS